jgi:O-antigen/teichoic acid export membrane protein
LIGLAATDATCAPGTGANVAYIGSDRPRGALAALVAQVKNLATGWLSGRSENSRAGRRAGTAFLNRMAGAVLAYASQALFARWMGAFEFGVYVYVWTWVMLLISLLDLGLAAGSQRFIPEYRERGQLDHLRGYLSGARRIGFGFSSLIAIIGAGLITLAKPWLEPYEVMPLYLGCLALPAYGLLNVQSAIARSHDWINLSQMPTFVLRQVIVIGLMGALFFASYATDAVVAVGLTTASLIVVAVGQAVVLRWRLSTTVERGPRTYDVRRWLSISLPMAIAETLYLMLTFCDVLILQLFNPPHDIAIYYAAQKTLALVGFVHYAVAQTAAHEFSKHHVLGDRETLAAALANAVRLTFWPSLAATIGVLVAGIPLLYLFGSEFISGYPLMFILAIGLMSRAIIGPLAACLTMVGQQRACAGIYGLAFLANLILCFALIPHFGMYGAASSTTLALILESIGMFWVTRRKLGLNGFAWTRRAAAAADGEKP